MLIVLSFIINQQFNLKGGRDLEVQFSLGKSFWEEVDFLNNLISIEILDLFFQILMQGSQFFDISRLVCG